MIRKSVFALAATAAFGAAALAPTTASATWYGHYGYKPYYKWDYGYHHYKPFYGPRYFKYRGYGWKY